MRKEKRDTTHDTYVESYMSVNGIFVKSQIANSHVNKKYVCVCAHKKKFSFDFYVFCKW